MFTAGNPGGGRPRGSKGSANKLADAFLETFDKLELTDKYKLYVWAEKNQGEFYKLISKMLPQKLAHEIQDKFIVILGDPEKDGAKKTGGSPAAEGAEGGGQEDNPPAVPK